MSDTEPSGSEGDAPITAETRREHPAGAVSRRLPTGQPVGASIASVTLSTPWTELQHYVTARRGGSVPTVYDVDAPHWSLGGVRRSGPGIGRFARPSGPSNRPVGRLSAGR